MKFKQPIALMIAALALGGCTDITDYPDGRIEFEHIFENPKLVGGYVNSAYVAAISSYNQAYGSNQYMAGATDEACDVDDVTNGAIYQWNMGYVTPFTTPLGVKVEEWDFYNSIRICNILVKRVEDATIRLESDRDSYRGEVRGLRAYYYLRLLKAYGGVPLVLDNVDEFDDDWSDATKASFAKVARQVIADCEWVLDDNYTGLEWISGGSDQAMCRWNKAMSAAVMSEAALYAASPLNYDESDPDAISWDEARDICKRALDLCLANGYALVTREPQGDYLRTSYNAYDYFFVSPIDTRATVDTESILYAKKRMAGWQYNGLPITEGQTSAGACPSQEFIDCFETIDGQRPILGYADADHLQPIPNPAATLYSETDPYANRDPRLKAMVYYNGVQYHPLEDDPSNAKHVFIHTEEGGNCAISANGVRNTRTGYYLRKFSSPESKRTSNNDGYTRVMRLAELYLNFAEAANEASTTGKAPAAAVDAVNAIRDRVGMPAIPYTVTVDEFRERVRNERRIELAFECHRFYDVRRWKILDETDRVVTGMRPRMEGENLVGYDRFVVQHRSAYAPKYLRMPIPGDEVARLINQTGINFQNPGW